MKTSLSRWILLSLVALGSSTAAAVETFERVGSLGANWEGLLLGSRQLAMGNADLADPQSAASWLYNPAALSATPPVQLAYDRLPDVFGSEIENASVSANWKGLRVGLVRSRLESDRILVRTAQDPEGTGEFVQQRQSFWLFGLGYELTRFLPADSGVRVAVGAALRHTSDDLVSLGATTTTEEVDGDDLDLGLSAGVARAIGEHELELLTMLSWQGAIQERSSSRIPWRGAPELLRVGVTVAAQFQLIPSLPGRIPGTLELRLAYARRALLDDSGPDSDQRGLEVVFLDLLALQAGRDDRFGNDSFNRGIGVQTPHGMTGPVRLRLYRTWVDDVYAVNPSSWKLWGLEAGATF